MNGAGLSKESPVHLTFIAILKLLLLEWDCLISCRILCYDALKSRFQEGDYGNVTDGVNAGQYGYDVRKTE